MSFQLSVNICIRLSYLQMADSSGSGVVALTLNSEWAPQLALLKAEMAVELETALSLRTAELEAAWEAKAVQMQVRREIRGHGGTAG